MTWSIIAKDKDTGAIGVAAASRAFAVGRLVPYIESGVGAVATQALVNPLYGRRGLVLIREGVPAADVVRLLADADAGREARQVHVLDARGAFAAFTGAECIDYSGHLAVDEISVAGNMLTGPEVLEATIEAFRASQARTFAARLIEALRGGERAGGDKRGRQSAGVLIHSTEEYPDLELRADDHVDPLAELERLEAVSRQRWVYFRKYLPSKANPVGETDRAVIDRGVEADLAEERRLAAESAR